MTNLILVAEMVTATWYLAFVVTKMGGPFQWFTRARDYRGGRWHGRTEDGIALPENYDPKSQNWRRFNRDGLLDCIICMMPYVAVMVIGLHHFQLDILYYPFSLAGAALMLHGFSGWLGRS